MKKKLVSAAFITMAITAVLVPFACKKNVEDFKEEVSTPLESMINGEETEVENYFLISASQTITPSGPINNIISAAGVFKDNQARVNAGLITINGRNIPQTSNVYSLEFADSLLSEGLGLPGTEIDLAISGNPSIGFSALQRRNYVPKNVFTSTHTLPVSHVNKSAGLPLNWQPDPQNINGKMYIQISYFAIQSQWNNPVFPKNISPVKYEVNDNGSFTIPARGFSSFPINSYIGISLGRGTEYVQCIKGCAAAPQNVYWFNIVHANTEPLIVRQ